jgi:OmpA-OmpF porin, OOP family
MKTLRALVLLGGSVLALGACSEFRDHTEIEALNEVNAVGSPFTRALTGEYRDFANREMNEMFDYPDALHFARKGLAAAAGEIVLPEPVSDWNLLPGQMEELGTNRGRLINALDKGARDIAPEQAATAQAQFDCWIEQQEENWQTEDILTCKTRFMESMEALESMIQPQPVIEEVTEGLAPIIQEELTEDVDMAAAPMKPEDAMYLVFFDFDSFALTNAGKKILDAMGEELGKQSPEIVHIVGHTDSAGDKAYNNRLAMKRANAVRDGLVERGVNAETIRVESRGEDELMVETADGTREPANRRAEITFE